MTRSENTSLAADIICAYVTKNHVTPQDLIALIKSVKDTINSIEEPAPEPDKPQPKQKPAVPIRKSITEEHLICLECGVRLSSLKKHLKASHNLTSEQYIAKWSLPSDYPMVAPEYAERRRKIAKTAGLGRPRKQKQPA